MLATGTSLIRRSGILIAIAALAVATSCSSDSSTTAASTTVERATTSAAATTGPADDTTATTVAGSSGEDPWTATAAEHRGADGKTFTYDCPAGGKAATIWGTETYTDDSSVCTAAVHVGLITFDGGGEVEIEIAPGEKMYEAATANDVESGDWGDFSGSFIFPKAPPGSGTFEVAASSWAKTAQSLQLEVGATSEVTCASDGTPGSVWGTKTYTADSSICTAAVHVGLIDAATGGTVRIEVVKGASAYKGSSSHGVTTSDYGDYDPAFVFTDKQPQQPDKTD